MKKENKVPNSDLAVLMLMARVTNLCLTDTAKSRLFGNEKQAFTSIQRCCDVLEKRFLDATPEQVESRYTIVRGLAEMLNIGIEYIEIKEFTSLLEAPKQQLKHLKELKSKDEN